MIASNEKQRFSASNIKLRINSVDEFIAALRQQAEAKPASNLADKII